MRVDRDDPPGSRRAARGGPVPAPVTGVLVRANEQLESDPNLAIADPYGEGWIAKVEMDGGPEGLLKATDPEFASFIAAEREKYGK